MTVFDLAAGSLLHPKSKESSSCARSPTDGKANAPDRLWLEGEGARMGKWGVGKGRGQERELEQEQASASTCLSLLPPPPHHSG